jgi:hypothetical protein
MTVKEMGPAVATRWAFFFLLSALYSICDMDNREVSMTPAWVISNAQGALVIIRSYAASMREKGILSAARWADGVAHDIEDRLAGRKSFPDYGPDLANLSAAG